MEPITQKDFFFRKLELFPLDCYTDDFRRLPGAKLFEPSHANQDSCPYREPSRTLYPYSKSLSDFSTVSSLK